MNTAIEYIRKHSVKHTVYIQKETDNDGTIRYFFTMKKSRIANFFAAITDTDIYFEMTDKEFIEFKRKLKKIGFKISCKSNNKENNYWEIKK